jgi:hypothetical protein
MDWAIGASLIVPIVNINKDPWLRDRLSCIWHWKALIVVLLTPFGILYTKGNGKIPGF